jgi:hypothetical protein
VTGALAVGPELLPVDANKLALALNAAGALAFIGWSSSSSSSSNVPGGTANRRSTVFEGSCARVTCVEKDARTPPSVIVP